MLGERVEDQPAELPPDVRQLGRRLPDRFGLVPQQHRQHRPGFGDAEGAQILSRGHNDFQGRIGATLAFRVCGNTNGSIWGSDVYTSDSTLATAAVHAGVLKPGQTAVVRVKILPSPQVYQGTSRNGVQSSSYGVYSAAFEFVRGSADD